MVPPSQVAGVKDKHLPILRNAVSVLPGLGAWPCAGGSIWPGTPAELTHSYLVAQCTEHWPTLSLILITTVFSLV